jgi:hypothetical protein
VPGRAQSGPALNLGGARGCSPHYLRERDHASLHAESPNILHGTSFGR